MPAIIDDVIEKKIRKVVYKILDIFNIQFGAAHIELKVDSDGQIYIIELASRIGGMRIEMINLAFGISYSQLLILSSLNMLSQIIYPLKYKTVQCKFLVDYETYQEYLDFKKNQDYVIFEPFPIPIIEKNFVAEHIGLSMGYYWVLSKK